MLIVTNWKMYGNKAHIRKYIDTLTQYYSKHDINHELVICPPTIYSEFIYHLISSNNLLGKVHVGAQDCHYSSEGPFTGGISAAMLVESGCKYVILGHSEISQSTEQLKNKIIQALKNGLYIIVCIGETKKGTSTEEFRTYIISTLNMIQDCISRIQNDAQHLLLDKIIITYEPVWAVGSTEKLPMWKILENLLLIKNVISKLYQTTSKIMYGGSLNIDNINEVLDLELWGVLLGRAGFSADTVLQILRNCDAKSL